MYLKYVCCAVLGTLVHVNDTKHGSGHSQPKMHTVRYAFPFSVETIDSYYSKLA